MEILLVLAIFLLAGAGLGLGLLIGKGPLKGSCGGLSCIKGAVCEGCPHRNEEARK